jgi:hypothetical protein
LYEVCPQKGEQETKLPSKQTNTAGADGEADATFDARTGDGVAARSDVTAINRSFTPRP